MNEARIWQPGHNIDRINEAPYTHIRQGVDVVPPSSVAYAGTTKVYAEYVSIWAE
eukprot:CAMPEP_0178536026 /NCGR_PEP_ID=MMETSP0696-20121128/35862_1 /TAXON_ID=265572 /ORGANISM="Extubocellulus spinifer, Strain CCMP396" /LENGTH=54 /DNA_ID=CAMNT_0020168211 /DNA_START=10 /DNA_END=174 /DNA_ORIENTATION=-